MKTSAIFVIFVICFLFVNVNTLEKGKNNLKQASNEDTNSNTATSTADICASVKEYTSALEDLELNSQQLIAAFNNHIKIIQKWSLDAKTPEDIEKFKAQAKTILDDYVAQAYALQTVLAGIKSSLSEISKAKCEGTPQEQTDNNQTGGSNTLQDVEKDTDTLIQKILKTYDQYGIKADPKYAALLQTKSAKKANLRKH